MEPSTKRFTLLAEGSSDESLIPILLWLWRQHRPKDELIEPQFVDPGYINLASHRLVDQLLPACDLYPCDVLFIHRDADRESQDTRANQIGVAVKDAFTDGTAPRAVCVIPVRMTEAWLLFHEPALRKAADNPNGQQPLGLPKLSQIESLPNPKQTLRELLRAASGLPPQRLRRFREDRAARLITQFIEDFSPLRKLSAFSRLEEEFADLKF